MRRVTYALALLVIIASIFLIAFSPDRMSMVFSVAMLGVVSAGMIFGIFPIIAISNGLRRGTRNMDTALQTQSGSAWMVISRTDPMFGQKTLDGLFANYKERVDEQRETGQMPADVEDYINEDIIGTHCWNNAVSQIPGTLTGLGILGTFLGLLIGLGSIGFSSVEAALTSVQELLVGIRIAFYTSIAGVILSIMFNIVHKLTWNIMTRQLEMYIGEFHRSVIPPAEEQERYQMRATMQQMLERLDRIPKLPAYASGGWASMMTAGTRKNEKILMPQIVEGLRKHQFAFSIQPKYDINTRTITGGEVMVRWEHEKLGDVSPSIFMPIVEDNGFIVKINEYIWEEVCKTIRGWIDAGRKCVPLAVNVSKSDILAGNVREFFESMLEKYEIPPRMLEIEIANNAFFETKDITAEIAKDLRAKGFKVIYDGFDGDFVQMNEFDMTCIDEAKCDIQGMPVKEVSSFIKVMYEDARRAPFTVTIDGIETMDQISTLRKAGCVTGQGPFFSNPLAVEKFEEKVNPKAK